MRQMGFERLKELAAVRLGVRHGMARSVGTLVGGTVFGQRLEKIDKVLLVERSDWLLVYGDKTPHLPGPWLP